MYQIQIQAAQLAPCGAAGRTTNKKPKPTKTKAKPKSRITAGAAASKPRLGAPKKTKAVFMKESKTNPKAKVKSYRRGHKRACGGFSAPRQWGNEGYGLLAAPAPVKAAMVALVASPP